MTTSSFCRKTKPSELQVLVRAAPHFSLAEPSWSRGARHSQQEHQLYDWKLFVEGRCCMILKSVMRRHQVCVLMRTQRSSRGPVSNGPKRTGAPQVTELQHLSSAVFVSSQLMRLKWPSSTRRIMVCTKPTPPLPGDPRPKSVRDKPFQLLVSLAAVLLARVLLFIVCFPDCVDKSWIFKTVNKV